MSRAAVDSAETIFQIRLIPKWELIDDVRTFVERYCSYSPLGLERAQQVALALHELMQNAVAYSEAGTFAEIGVVVDPKHDLVVLQVANLTQPEHIARLQAKLADVYQDTSPMAAFVRIMKEAPGAGGLGLARIRCESRLDVEVSVTGRGVLVEAFGPLVAPPQSAEPT